MKDSGKCPKCGGQNISRVPKGMPKISIGINASATIVLYVCITCGFTEGWMDSAIDRDDLAKLFPPKKA